MAVQKLTGEQCRILAKLADPEWDPISDDAANDPLRVFSPSLLVEVAQFHGVAPIVCRNLKALAASDNPTLAQVLETAHQDAMLNAAVMLDLDQHGLQVTRALQDENIPFRMVKGQQFARDLYKNLNDRPYTDIDIVVGENALERAQKAAEALGFVSPRKPFLDQSERNREIKLEKPGVRHILVELHANLVHMPALRRSKTIGLPELERAYSNGATALPGHFIVAVVHASLGHKFHNLKLMVDCLQSLRRVPEEDFSHLKILVHDLHLKREAALCLELCKQIFASPDVAEKVDTLADQLRLPSPSRLVRAVDVVQAPFAQSSASKWRRRLFRLTQL